MKLTPAAVKFCQSAKRKVPSKAKGGNVIINSQTRVVFKGAVSRYHSIVIFLENRKIMVIFWKTVLEK